MLARFTEHKREIKMKRINPYTRLLNEIKEFCGSVMYRSEKEMWYYPIKKLGSEWNLDDLYQRTAAANQLGHEVHVRADKKGLIVTYVKELPYVPHDWRY